MPRLIQRLSMRGLREGYKARLVLEPHEHREETLQIVVPLTRNQLGTTVNTHFFCVRLLGHSRMKVAGPQWKDASVTPQYHWVV